MYHLGVLDFQIGLILMIGRLAQMSVTLFGGIITDKFGRRWTTFIFDCLSWSIPALIWAFSQNFWWFVAAALVNGLMQVTTVSWECLWVDDAEESLVAPVFNWIYISGLLAVFFAPISGYFVQIYGVVPVVRVIYLITFVMMTAKFIILYFFSTETKRGLERMEATKNVTVREMLSGYKEVFRMLISSKNMVSALALQAMIGIIMLVNSTFFALYATQNLGMPDAFLAYFPILRAGIMLLFLLFIQERLNRFSAKNVMLTGLSLYIFAMLWLINAPIGNLIWLASFVIMDACSAALLMPRIDTLAANAIDPRERARVRSLFNMIILAVSSPFALFAGTLSDMDRRLPFVLCLVLLLGMVFVVVKSWGRRHSVG